jgi:hypothetical protein
MGAVPTYPTCAFALSWWIRRGHAGDLDLRDLKVVMTGAFEEHGSNPWRVILYVDESAAAAQREALVALFLGRAGGSTYRNFAAKIAEVYAVRTTAIELDHTPTRERIEVPPYLIVRTKEPVGHDFTVTCGVPGHDRPGQELRAELFRHADPPFDWEFRGRCGFATDFRYTSD